MEEPSLSQPLDPNQQYDVVRLRLIKIFLSSPSDVAEERKLARKTVDHLNSLPFINEHVLLRLYAYEEAVPPITVEEPQKSVDQYMITPDRVDIFVCLLWNRMGTPFQDEITKEHYLSGTEYEFIYAYQASLKRKQPVVLLYRCIRLADPKKIDPIQSARVNAFFGRFMGNDAAFKGLYKSYSTLDEFEQNLFQDLSKLINELMKNERLQHISAVSPLAILASPSEEPFNLTNVKNINMSFMTKNHEKAILDVCFAAKRPHCISTAHDHSIAFYNVEHHIVDFTVDKLQNDIQAIAHHPGSHLLAGVNERGEVILWNTHTYQREKTLFSGERYLTDIAFSTNGAFLCAISRKGTGWCWQTDTWELRQVICQFQDAACSLAFSPDGVYLAIACFNGDLVIWNCQTWTLFKSYSFDGELTTVQFIPGKPILALGFEHGEIQLWDYSRSLLLASFIHHSERITDLAVLGNGQLLFSISTDQHLVGWDLEERKSLFEILTENDVPLTLAIHPKETIAVVGTASGRVLWYTTHT